MQLTVVQKAVVYAQIFTKLYVIASVTVAVHLEPHLVTNKLVNFK